MKNFSDLCNVKDINEINQTMTELRQLIQQGVEHKRRLNTWFESDDRTIELLESNPDIKQWYHADKKKFNTIFELPREFKSELDEIFNENIIKSLIIHEWCDNSVITYSDIIRYHYYVSESGNIDRLLKLLTKYNFGELIYK